MARKPIDTQEIQHNPPLPDDLRRMQTEADCTEPEPPVVPLARELEEGQSPGEKPRYKDQPPKPPVAGADPVPRTVHQNERAPAGLARFKLRVVNYGEQSYRYILATDLDEAKAHYLRSTGLKDVIDSIPPADRAEPRFSVRALVD